MEEHEMITLLRHKRHDWMNQIQLIHGYASMNKPERLMEQLEKVIEESEEERCLLNSGADQFILWLLTFNWKEEGFRLQFHFREDLDLSRHDRELMAFVDMLMNEMKHHQIDGELYEGVLHIYRGFDPGSINLSWEWQGKLSSSDELKRKLEAKGCIATIYDEEELSVEMMIEG